MARLKLVINKSLSVSTAHKEIIQSFSVADGLLIFVLFLVVLIILSSLFVFKHGNLLVLFNCVLILLPFVLLYFKNQNSETIGWTKKYLLKSSLLGLAIGLVFFLLLPTQRFWPLNTPWHVIITVSESISLFTPRNFIVNGLLFFAIPVAVGEEILFRGYIQTRAYGVIKNTYLAIFIVGLMFAILHMPSLIFWSALYADIPLTPFSSYLTAVANYFSVHFASFLAMFAFYIIMHITFYWSYMKFNNIATPIIIHFLLNLRQLFPGM